MTNFDVIESYADDFTKWRIENTGVTSTQKKIVIAAGTELKYNVTYRGFGNSIAEFDIKYTGNAVIRYQYNKEDGTTGIITDRTWFKDKVKTWSYFADKKKAFVFERTSNGKSFNANSFAAETAIELQKDGVSYQTKASYNGNAINYHSDQADNDDKLVIGSTKDSLGNQCFIGCHGDILLFNRTLTEYEISWVKNNMMCSKQQEPDIDL